MLAVCKNKEDILQNAEEILLEEASGDGRIRVGDVIDHLQADAECSVGNVAHCCRDGQTSYTLRDRTHCA